MEKVFGSLKITWPKLIIFAVVTGVYTGVMASLPITKDTSFADISITFECWILFGIIIIVNSTKLILEAPDGSRKVFDLTIERNSYQISEAPAG